MTTFEKALFDRKIEYISNCPMSSYTSFKIGGNADWLITPANDDELTAVLKICREHGVPFMPLGRGTNLLISDDGIEGAVIHLSKKGGSISLSGEREITCSAGVSLASLCLFARDNGLSGLEFAYGIPGSVGGAVYMNAGAYGGEMKDVVKSVTFATAEGGIKTLPLEELDFSYRHSIFFGKSHVVLSVKCELVADGRSDIEKRMAEIAERRKSKQPLELPSAGSTFKRPQGYFAGTLIEQCGLKGFTVGGAQVSEKHAGFIVNIGGATCSDVMCLIEHIQNVVMEKHGVLLEPEIIKTGR